MSYSYFCASIVYVLSLDAPLDNPLCLKFPEKINFVMFDDGGRSKFFPRIQAELGPITNLLLFRNYTKSIINGLDIVIRTYSNRKVVIPVSYVQSIFTANFTRLEDILIPLPVFNKVVAHVEGTKSAEFEYYEHHSDGTSVNATDQYWVLPYPFKTPAIPDFKSAGDSKLTTEQHLFWKEQLRIRSWGFVTNAVKQEHVNLFDNNPDLGVILNILSGSMIFFNYSCIDELIITLSPYQLDGMFHNLKRTHEITPDIEALSGTSKSSLYKRIYEQAYSRIMPTYHFVYNKPDELNPDRNDYTGVLNTLGLYPFENAQTIAEDILRKFHEHKKIIVTM